MPILYVSVSRGPLPRYALLVFKVRLASSVSQLYCVWPISGKVDPGQTVKVQGAIYLLVFTAVG